MRVEAPSNEGRAYIVDIAERLEPDRAVVQPEPHFADPPENGGRAGVRIPCFNPVKMSRRQRCTGFVANTTVVPALSNANTVISRAARARI